jgi:AraC-like DNA-binding protein
MGPRQPRRDIDEQALNLRETGQSYAAVARTLGLKRATDAQAAFVRAARSRPEAERAELSKREAIRLDQLEKRIRARDAEDPVKLERRLTALEALRQALP